MSDPSSDRYRPNAHVPKPDPLLAKERLLPTYFFRLEEALELGADPSTVTVKQRGHVTQQINLDDGVRAIVAFGRIAIDPWTVEALLERQIPVVYFSSNGKFLGRLEGERSQRPGLIRAQAMMSQEQRLSLAQAIAWGTLRRYRRYLLRQARDRQAEFQPELIQLSYAIESIYKAPSVEVVKGFLGRGTQAYYAAMMTLIPAEWHCNNRKEDKPFNRIMNFAYTLLEESALVALVEVGLDHRLGIWSVSPRSKGLVGELASEFRQMAAAVVIRAINRRQIKLEQFERYQGAHLPLDVAGTLISEYSVKMAERFRYPFLEFETSYQEAIYLQAVQIALYLSRKIPEYVALSLK